MNAAEAHNAPGGEPARPAGPQVVLAVRAQGHDVMKQLIADGYLGSLREGAVCHLRPTLPIRGAALLAAGCDAIGLQMLTLASVHETPDALGPAPVEVQAPGSRQVATRIDPPVAVLRPSARP